MRIFWPIYLSQAAGADSVRTLLVLLHLLECYADPPAKLSLREAFLQPADADILADLSESGGWRRLGSHPSRTSAPAGMLRRSAGQALLARGLFAACRCGYFGRSI